MIAHKILLPTDFSDFSLGALGMALSLARDNGASLVLVHVAQPVTIAAGESYFGRTEPDRAELLQQLDEVLPPGLSIPCTSRVEVGDPATGILRVSEEEGCDLIVMATHGRTGVTRLMMGSVAEEVVRRANCPVLTLKHPVAEPALA